ncbi:DUF4835 family protein [Foetidibacter luteolus]|uniref:type IX secretion system protein PorD n=1 Tax=Foetidibacter luteolus TaxID=2608880 RepID=UPI00129B428D|nr:DUF4835 family protein [Foetidibacter luteolus]
MRKLFNLLFAACLCFSFCSAQEFQAKVTVNAQRVSTQVDKKIFNTLQTQLTNLLNNRKWTNDTYQPNEKIQCFFLLSIESTDDQNIYRGSLTVQAARPVYNSAYKSPLVNFQDADVNFKYVEYQPVEFNENRVQGNDPLAANLTAIFAYYANIILGMDYDSYSLKGGDAYFRKAQNIVNNSPEGRSISGWKVFDGLRNRYWLVNNVVDPKNNMLHDIFYGYYRNGLDNMYENEILAREQVLDVLNKLQDFNQQSPNTMILQFFMQSRSQELIGMFKKADPQSKSKALELLSKLDIANTAKYREELK